METEIRIEPIMSNMGPEGYNAEYGITDYRDKVILDVGADVGSTADYFLRKGASNVIAVEGNKKFYIRLEENAKRFQGITPISLWIETPEHFAELILKYRPDMIKCDCEGCEKSLFEISDDTFNLVSEYIVETHTEALFKSMISKCTRNGFETHLLIRHREWLRIVYARKQTQEEFNPPAWWNKSIMDVFQKWRGHIKKNLAKKYKWYHDLPYDWWHGMSMYAFIESLPEHLDQKREPKWFVSQS